MFGGLGERLSARGRAITIDLPGYGEAPGPPRVPTVERMVRTIEGIGPGDDVRVTLRIVDA